MDPTATTSAGGFQDTTLLCINVGRGIPTIATEKADVTLSKSHRTELFVPISHEACILANVPLVLSTRNSNAGHTETTSYSIVVVTRRIWHDLVPQFNATVPDGL